MKFIMIVLITSCEPNRALSAPGIAPHTAPAPIAAIIAIGIRTNPGNFVKVIPTQAAANAPTYNCPSAPMFNNPHLNASATARPVKISGVV